MVDPTSQGRACSSTGKGWDYWLLLRVLAISMNPGGGVCGRAQVLSSGVSTSGLDIASPANLDSGLHLCILGLLGGVFTCWVKMFGAPEFWLEPAGVFAVEGIMSFECPMPMVGPLFLVLVPQFLHLLCFPGGKDSMVSLDLDWVIYIQLEGSTGLNTWAFIKMVNGSIQLLNSLMHSLCYHRQLGDIIHPPASGTTLPWVIPWTHLSLSEMGWYSQWRPTGRLSYTPASMIWKPSEHPLKVIHAQISCWLLLQLSGCWVDVKCIQTH